ncbi:MAG: FG-GAP repeat domain-containing protein, partial [Flavobacteriales bacterium]
MKKALILVVLLAQTLCYHAQFSQQTNLYDAGFVDSPHFLRMGDIDGDGINDLVFCNGSQGGELEYVRGNADGTFDTDEVALYGNNEFQNITTFEVADIDEDGDDDIAAYVDGSPNGDLYLLENNSGSFSSPQLILENIGNLTNVRIADLGQDGLKDIIICEVYSGAPEILYQTSPFVFNYVDTSNNGIPTEGGRYLELQDIDNDGDQDIKFHGTGDIGVALNNGSGEFTDSFVLSGPNISNQEVLVEDFDNDGDFEVVRMTYDGIEFLEWIDGELIFAYDISIDEDAFFTGMLTEDFNLDGFPDLVFYCWSSCTTSVVMNDGTGQMNHTIPLCGMTSIPERGLITQYLNSDGAPDIVACRSSNRVIRGIQNELPLCSDPGACNYNSEYSGDDLNCNYNNCG